MPLIGTDGVLGPETCGAQSYLASHGFPEHGTALQTADCREFDYPPSASAPTTAPPVAPPNASTTTVSGSRKAGMGTLGWLLIASGVAAAGIYLAMGRKRR